EQLTAFRQELNRRSVQLEVVQDRLQKELETLKSLDVPEETKAARRKLSARAANEMNLSESETRRLIDQQLSAAGWHADTKNLRYAKGARPEKGTYKAIAEWPTASGPADYALFVGMNLVGVVEAKKKARDVVSDLRQAKRYARDVEIKGEERFIGGPWGEYKVPLLFVTNGRPYLKQLEQKSGIWFLDGRRPINHPRPLHAWYSPQGAIELLQQDQDKAESELKKEPFDYLGLRDYQIRAVKKIEESLEEGKRAMLLAMATGTGKTLTAIGLLYRLIKTSRFRHVLFLVDRNALGLQAEDKFKETRLEDLQTFDQIFDLKGVKTTGPEETTRVHISTVQGMIRRIMFNVNDDAIPTVDQYDCIVVDEAHRGYTLDKELGEVEILYRDEKDYISKYRRVLEYFDAVKIGLTATPAPHTIEIFGKPVFTYSYREGVIDGWLVDHEPPHQIVTKLKKEGITWKKGDTVPVYDPATQLITNIEDIPDDLTLEIEHFNKLVITENFNRTVAEVLVRELDPYGEEKTLIFATTDDHADLVVKILKEEFEKEMGEVDDDAIEKITGSIDKPIEMILKFKNEKFPTIAVTVDLLTTGIDVHEICNLVFLRRVRSRILYEQMLGRATRLCDRIRKDHFNIFDAVGLYEALEPVTNMKAVAPGPTVTFQQLVKELSSVESEGQQKCIIEQLIAKLQKKDRVMGGEEREEFETLSGGETLQQLIKSIRGKDIKRVSGIIKGKQNLLAFLDENRYQPRKQFISRHEDELFSHKRGYGKGEKPEDYLNEFQAFIINNMNKIPALAIICQRPRKLTRHGLKELKMALDQQGYTEPNLRTAWREWKNEDIAADIISFIRRQALGDHLVSHEDRIRKAMKKVYGLEKWTKIQRQWLERIEKQLIAETVFEREDFDKGAFKDHGGFHRLNKIFQGNLNTVLDEINNALYPEERKYA
ncbi:MAG: type I restriction-modification system endonuclease, partial [Desulfobacterales bacterium]|nr:type I restriction-modification system endonuclease [Desulfobacterales bacterium]